MFFGDTCSFSGRSFGGFSLYLLLSENLDSSIPNVKLLNELRFACEAALSFNIIYGFIENKIETVKELDTQRYLLYSLQAVVSSLLLPKVTGPCCTCRSGFDTA